MNNRFFLLQFGYQLLEVGGPVYDFLPSPLRSGLNFDCAFVFITIDSLMVTLSCRFARTDSGNLNRKGIGSEIALVFGSVAY